MAERRTLRRNRELKATKDGRGAYAMSRQMFKNKCCTGQVQSRALRGVQALDLIEVRMGFEPTYDGFANRCLTTWLPHQPALSGRATCHNWRFSQSRPRRPAPPLPLSARRVTFGAQRPERGGALSLKIPRIFAEAT